MSEPGAKPSPIQQRIALGRLRLIALFMMIGWGAMAVLRVVGLRPTEVLDWIVFLFTLGLASYGVKLWFDYRRRLDAFEAEHGPGTGKRS
jgi:hypothetical protein